MQLYQQKTTQLDDNQTEINPLFINFFLIPFTYFLPFKNSKCYLSEFSFFDTWEMNKAMKKGKGSVKKEKSYYLFICRTEEWTHSDAI